MMARAQLVTPAAADADRTVLRRQCAACGAKAGASAQSCPDCERKRLQPKLVIGSQQAAEEREADRVADAVMRDGDGRTRANVGAIASAVQRSSAAPATATEPRAPPIVDQVLGRSGQPLDPDARRFFERSFARDFSNVRVHADAEAAASARAVDAQAYTVGNHLVFGASRYAPDTVPGRRLLAHELTHVIQQDATLRRTSQAPRSGDEGHRDDDDDPRVTRIQRDAAGGANDAGPSDGPVGAAVMASTVEETTAGPEECKPSTPPGWDSFNGPVAAGSTWGAETHWWIGSVPAGSKMRFQARLDANKSWVKPKFRYADDPARNESGKEVADCEAWLTANDGGWWALNTESNCAAYPTARGDRATNVTECTTVVAVDHTDKVMAISPILLKHEQNHVALTCAMAKKGNAALAAGKPFSKVSAVIFEKTKAAQKQYDDQTKHACDAGQQSTWETKIAAGLPGINLP